MSNGDTTAEWFAMVHLPISMKQAMQFPNAKKAVDKEWDTLPRITAWDVTKL